MGTSRRMARARWLAYATSTAALVLGIVVPSLALADNSDGLSVRRLLDPRGAISVAAVGQQAEQGDQSTDQEQTSNPRAFQIQFNAQANNTEQRGSVKGKNYVDFQPEVAVSNEAQSGDVRGYGNRTNVDVEAPQDASAQAEGDIEVDVQGGSANARNSGKIGDNAGRGGNVDASLEPEVYSGDIHNRSGESENDASGGNAGHQIAIGGGNALSRGGEAEAQTEAEGGDGGSIGALRVWDKASTAVDGNGDSEIGAASNRANGGSANGAEAEAKAGSSAVGGGGNPAANTATGGVATSGGNNPATNNGSTGTATSNNSQIAVGGNGGTVGHVAVGGVGGDAAATNVGHVVVGGVNNFGLNVQTTGSSTNTSGAVTTAPVSAVVSPSFSQNLSQSCCQSQTVDQGQTVNQNAQANPNLSQGQSSNEQQNQSLTSNPSSTATSAQLPDLLVR